MALTRRGLVMQDMLEYEDKLIATKYKFGILYCRANQSTEDQMYNNGNVSYEPPWLALMLHHQVVPHIRHSSQSTVAHCLRSS
jgi:hypothetical protein